MLRLGLFALETSGKSVTNRAATMKFVNHSKAVVIKPLNPRMGDNVPTYTQEEVNALLTPSERAYLEKFDERGDIDHFSKKRS